MLKTISILASASMVAGHGFVTSATLGDTEYTFYQPYTDPYTSPTPERVSRPIQGNGPVTDLSYQDIQCGGDTLNGIVGSSPANLTATVAAGSTVDLVWTLWPESHVGPSITYMARCDNDDCTTFMPSDAVWFKVQEEGRDGTSNTWGTTAIMTEGGSISYTVPSCIESGAYLVRHEVIALHSAYSAGGAQFYPGCHQIEVTGGTGASTPSDLVAFPGGYSAEDPGILYDAYAATTYTVPGPALFSCSGSTSSSSSGSTAASSSAAAVTTAAAAAATVAPSTAASSAPASTFTTLTTSVDVAAAVATSTTTDEEDDDCEAEVTVTSTYPAAAATATAAASSGTDAEDDDSCEDDSSSTSTVGAATGDSTDDGSDEDDSCDEEEPTATATATAAAQATGSASGSDEEDCDAEEEQAYARRWNGRFARGM